jgi:hypothetical protein
LPSVHSAPLSRTSHPPTPESRGIRGIPPNIEGWRPQTPNRKTLIPAFPSAQLRTSSQGRRRKQDRHKAQGVRHKGTGRSPGGWRWATGPFRPEWRLPRGARILHVKRVYASSRETGVWTGPVGEHNGEPSSPPSIRFGSSQARQRPRLSVRQVSPLLSWGEAIAPAAAESHGHAEPYCSGGALRLQQPPAASGDLLLVETTRLG